MSVRTNSNLQSAQHLGDLFFLLVDEENIFQHDGPAFLTGMQNQTAGPEQQVFEDIIDFFVESSTV